MSSSTQQELFKAICAIAGDTRPQTGIKEPNSRIVEHDNRLRAVINVIIRTLEEETI